MRKTTTVAASLKVLAIAGSVAGLALLATFPGRSAQARDTTLDQITVQIVADGDLTWTIHDKLDVKDAVLEGTGPCWVNSLAHVYEFSNVQIGKLTGLLVYSDTDFRGRNQKARALSASAAFVPGSALDCDGIARSFPSGTVTQGAFEFPGN